MSIIADNLSAVRQRIDAVARKSGRTGEDINLIVVTKTRSVAEIREAIACGVTDTGENYVQEAELKFGEIGDIVRWHMIGHLQRNKVRHVVEFISMIHSVDDEALAREISRRAEAIGKCIDVLIEVKVSGEPTKFGIGADEALRIAEGISQLSGIRVSGLMGMAPFLADPRETRPYFLQLKELWDKLPDEQRLYLSMGMTQDFEIAIEEGSNMVRIGTAIFGQRA
ncbi:MAG: YggS family pyridoxal phosphate-dependent enzyme [Armatimonadetes bacterium]|nr:YggS family pyridoxal phosphate-dependent enzyme [Armatimonadota bacterium]